jgi:hypothetical protein
MNGGVGAAIVDGFEIGLRAGANELFPAGSISKAIAALTALRLGFELEQRVGPGPVAV